MHSRNLKLLKASGMDERTGFIPIQIVKAAATERSSGEANLGCNSN
jgi:hypothetical protein